MKDFMKRKQIGVIVFGGGLDVRNAMHEWEIKGFSIMIRSGYAEIYI